MIKDRSRLCGNLIQAEGIKLAALISHVLAAQLCAICPSFNSQAGCRTFVYLTLAVQNSADTTTQSSDLLSRCLTEEGAEFEHILQHPTRFAV